MVGSKDITNNTGYAVSGNLMARNVDWRNWPFSLANGKTKTVPYGNDTNGSNFLDGLLFWIVEDWGEYKLFVGVEQIGGNIDNAFNTNSKIDLEFDQQTKALSFKTHN